MTQPVGGDPASLSSLAATLIRVADALETQGSLLGSAEGGPLLSATLRGLHDSGRALRVCAGALQDYAVDLQHVRAPAAQAEEAQRPDQAHRRSELDDARRLARRVAEPVRALRATSDAVASAVRTATGR